MLLTTTPTVEGKPVRTYYGVVTGETIIGANFVRDFFAGIRDFVGGRSKSYERVLREAKDFPKWQSRLGNLVQTPLSA